MNNTDKCFNSDGVLVTPPDYIGTAIFPDLQFNILDDSLVMAVIKDPTNAASYLNNLSPRDVSNLPADDDFQFEICHMRGIDSLSDSLNYSAFLAEKIGNLKNSMDELLRPTSTPTPPTSDPAPSTTAE